LDYPSEPLYGAYVLYLPIMGGWEAEWLACWTQAQKGLGINRSGEAVG